MNKTQIFKDSISGQIQMVSEPIDPSTEQGLVRDIFIHEMALYGPYAQRLLVKKPQNNFHAGTSNGVPKKRR